MGNQRDSYLQVSQTSWWPIRTWRLYQCIYLELLGNLRHMSVARDSSSRWGNFDHGLCWKLSVSVQRRSAICLLWPKHLSQSTLSWPTTYLTMASHKTCHYRGVRCRFERCSRSVTLWKWSALHYQAAENRFGSCARIHRRVCSSEQRQKLFLWYLHVAKHGSRPKLFEMLKKQWSLVKQW